MTNKCLECERELFGRVDKKFCSDQCRTTFNNKKNREETSYVKKVNSILKQNRRILKKENPKGKIKIKKNKLIESGFNFEYFTNEYITKTGNVYRFCYDYGYIELENNMLALVVRQSYLDK